MVKKDLVEIMAKEIKLKDEKKKRYRETTEYMDYIEEQLKYIKGFDSSMVHSSMPYKRSKEMSEDLGIFFGIIDEYARKNYINGEKSNYETSYCIRYNGNIYEISLLFGQGAMNYIQKLDKVKSDTVIDFTDIMENQLSLRAVFIETELKKLKEKIEIELESLLEKGINIMDIKNSLNKIINNIQNKKMLESEKGTQKTLK